MNENEVTYSLYTYECGNLKIFGNSSRRTKYKTIDEAVQSARKWIDRLATVNRISTDRYYRTTQVLVVKYIGAWESQIVGVITSEDIRSIPWRI